MMSKFSYDDLPWDVADKLQCLDFELREGDITEKGYEKKRAQLLEPYKELIEQKTREANERLLQRSVPQPNEQDTTFEAAVDLGPEPSAADVTDFLDFLPSPTHSPVDNKGVAFMETNYQHQQANAASASSAPPPPPPPARSMTAGTLQVRPNTLQQHSPRPLMPENGYRPSLPPNYNMRPTFDPRMGPPRPVYTNNNMYPNRPQLNGFRPPAPGPVSPAPPPVMYRPQQQNMYGYRPPPPQAAASMKSGPPTPTTNIIPPFSQQLHTRSPSFESKSGYAQSIRQNSDQIGDSEDWETGSTSWRPNVARDPSVMSASSRIHQSNNGLSYRRSRTNANVGRSRYHDSYMASTFKAIEPAPQPKLLLNDPVDQMFLADLAGRQMTPLKGRPIPFTLYDADNKTILTDFGNLAELLRFRSTKHDNRFKDAFVLVDARGKEPDGLNWDKLNARAEKIANTIRQKGKVKSGDRVALIYRRSEVLEFIPALFGCFLAGVTAVPINAAEDLAELSFILTITNISLILTTDYNQRMSIKNLQAKQIEFPSSITWWNTNTMGTWYPSKKAAEYPMIKVPEVAYIEYAKASNGELKGVTVTHASIMEQCAAFQSATTETNVTTTGDGGVEVQPKQNGRSPDTVVSYYEPRQQIGLVLSILNSIYAGNSMIFTSGSIVDTPAVWIYVLSKYKATMALAEYPALKSITKYYQSHTKEVKSHSKKVTPDLSSLRYLIIDTNTVRPELNQYIADKLLRPLGNTYNPLEVVCPVLSLTEHGGKIVSMRDNLGPASTEEVIEQNEVVPSDDGQQITRSIKCTRSVLAPSGSRDIFTCLFDLKALKENKVLVLAAGAEADKAESKNEPGRVCVEAFGFCMPKINLAVVDPETGTLCPPDTLGEIWIDSPSISGGFWALPKHTESIFHARPVVMNSDMRYPEVYSESFLRTGLSGTTIGGRLFVLGSYEERIRQQRFGGDFGVEDTFYASELLNTISKRTHIDQCAIFEILVKDQHLPVVICESSVARANIAPIATDIDEALIEFYGLRTYAIIFVRDNGLPRQLVHGRPVIHVLKTKKHFLEGRLNIRYVKIDVDRTIFNLSMNDDPSNNLWRSGMAYDRALRTGAILPHPQQQHTGMDRVRNVLDGRTGYDLSRFTNIVDILQWRTTLYPEETAYTVSTQNGSNINTKTYTWRKISYRSATVATYLCKKGLKRANKVMVMMPFGIDYIFCIYACLVLGVVPIPIEPVDPMLQVQRITEFSEQIVEVAKDLGVKAILTNADGDDVMRHHALRAAIKQYSPTGFKLPEVINISKAAKHHKLLGKESGFMVRSDWINGPRNSPTVILLQTASDGRRFYAYLGHDTILNQCRSQKMTCQMHFKRSIVTTGLGTYEGLGFLHALFCGIYVGSSTVLIPSADFYLNPAVFFESLQRYKTKDAFLTNALVQFAMKRMNANDCRPISLKGVQNIMLANDNRPKPLLYQHMVRYFARLKLDKEAINTVYSHAANPMITTRSYMLLEPLAISLDPYWLRQGIVRALTSEEESFGVLLNDSGIVPSNTMVAIVNPETHTLCPSNVVGEIWVSSDSNAKTFYNLDDMAHAHRFEATIAGRDPNIKYMRTGDFGFLWNVRRRVDNRMMQPMMEEGQCLYVLGPVSETIVRNGLMHFPIDIEQSIERCHTAIPSDGSIVFQYKDEVVVVVSVKGNENALSVVPLVVNAVLENHSFLVDTVVVVHPSIFPKTRFGDKSRRKAFISFAEKKLTAIYVKRITNQHESLLLPHWTQSQLSGADVNTISDNTSIHTNPRAQSVSDYNSEFDKQSIAQQLVRQDTSTSRYSHNSGSVAQTPI